MKQTSSAPKPETSRTKTGQKPEPTQGVTSADSRWNQQFFQLDCVFALVNLVLGSIFFVIFWMEGLLTLPPLLYALLYLVLPSMVNLLILVAAVMVGKHLPEQDSRQNAIPACAMLLICLSICLTHQIFPVTLAVFCIPICMTAVYGSQKLCGIATLASLAGALIALVRLLLAAADQERMQVLAQGLIIVCVLLSLGAVVRVICSALQPVRKEPELPRTEPTLLHPVAQRGEAQQQSSEARILVVDDAAVNLEVLVNLLKSTGIRVDTATSGRRCLEMVTRAAYDLIFMDHMMPEMDGMETYIAMRKQEKSLNRNTPVVMLTANEAAGVREQFLAAGFADYLSKPVSSEKLDRMLQKYLPREKYRAGAVGQKAVPEGDTDCPKELRQLRRLYPKVDLEEGLKVSGGSFELYLDLLQTYAEQAAADRLDECMAQKNAHEYMVCVHGIKSASLSVGFTDLAARARALENAARLENWVMIEANHGPFLAEYRQAVNAARQVLRL